MLTHKTITNLEDYFKELNTRTEKGVYFYRINSYSEETAEFIKKYYDLSRRTGGVIEGRIPNPDEKNLEYYSEMMGMKFEMSPAFINASLKKWLPRMNDYQRGTVADAIYASLEKMSKAGKTENMLKNAYIKYMCWLYYKFERIVNRLGENTVPKILYEGEISSYELMLISILSDAGCDVVLLQYKGDAVYLKSDPESKLSFEYKDNAGGAFPEGYCLKKVREDLQNDVNNERLYGKLPSVRNCTNAWLSGNVFEDIEKAVTVRGDDRNFYYNCFCRVNGADDKITYANDLLKFRQELKNSKRHTVIVNREIPRPTPEEIAGIKRENYASQDQMIMGISTNLNFIADPELKCIIRKNFIDSIIAESKTAGMNLNRLTNKAVYVLCWLKRYWNELLPNWKMPDIGCFIYTGGCKNENEAMFVSFLARLPVDVLILCPNLNVRCVLEDKLLYEVNNTESLSMEDFPDEGSHLAIGTAAYHAERELDDIMYRDSGIYRNRQYSSANVINLQTMYEEISILWKEELKYRPNFATVDGVVNMPVIFAKVSGVKDGLVPQYWLSIKELVTPETILVTKAPYISPTADNPLKAYSAEFYKNGRLNRTKIKNHPGYQYGILREETQEFILDKLQLMIEQKLIKGIGENGTEYTVIAQVLNLPKPIVRLIQNFDFTKKNPKLIYINTAETVISLEDTILTAFLNLIGFDILFFVPTGYRSIEKFFNTQLMEEHQIGEYKYDLFVPDLNKLSLGNTRHSWRDLFKRGN